MSGAADGGALSSLYVRNTSGAISPEANEKHLPRDCHKKGMTRRPRRSPPEVTAVWKVDSRHPGGQLVVCRMHTRPPRAVSRVPCVASCRPAA